MILKLFKLYPSIYCFLDKHISKLNCMISKRKTHDFVQYILLLAIRLTECIFFRFQTAKMELRKMDLLHIKALRNDCSTPRHMKCGPLVDNNFRSN